MNYFEILDVSRNETDGQVLAAAYHKARTRWQTLLSQDVGEQERLARALMNGGLETAYETLANPTKRQQYLRELKLAEETGIPMRQGRVRVSFSLANGHADHDFLVVDNPVRHPLESNGLAITSLQEYVCRAWEAPDLAQGHLAARTLERWVRYAAGETLLADALRYLAWDPDGLPAENQLFIALDLLQSKYPAPILPRSPSDLVERLPSLLAPHWHVDPPILNFGLVGDRVLPMVVTFSAWGTELGRVTAEVDDPGVELYTDEIDQGRLEVSLKPDLMPRGELLECELMVRSENLGVKKVPIIAARANLMWANRELADDVNLTAGEVAMEKGEYPTALRCFRVAGAVNEAGAAALALLERAYARHDWLGVIELARYYKDHVDAHNDTQNDTVQLRLVEALGMVAGSIFQLGEYRRALEYLAALACATAQLADKATLAASWTAQPEAQLRLNLEDAKADWVQVTEAYGLNWTHATGKADGSHYAGEVPLDLSARRVLWESRAAPLVAPLLAYEGLIFGNLVDNRGVAALDAASGRVQWRRDWPTVGGRPAPPVAGGACFFAADPMGTLYALDVVTGKEQWSVRLADAHDLALAYSDGLLYVGTGKRLALYHAETGESLFVSDEMTTFFGLLESNPQNILITDSCCLFQRVGGTDPSMVFVDLESGETLEFQMPFQRSLVGSLLGRIFTGSAGSKVTWAAYAGEIYLPLSLTMQLECRVSYRDSDGRVKEKVERKTWGELHLYVYNARHNKILAHCAVTPAYVEQGEDGSVLWPPRPDQPPHRLVATAFGRDVYYWISTHEVVKQAGSRRVDGGVKSIAYLGLYDLVTTDSSLSTSFVGNTEGGNATALALPSELKGLDSAPALYGDVIYLLSRSGRVVALGR